MALHLKRIVDPYFCCRCDITRKIIAYGDYYYEDDEDGFIVDYNYYYDRKMAEKMEKALLDPEIQAAQDSISYQTQTQLLRIPTSYFLMMQKIEIGVKMGLMLMSIFLTIKVRIKSRLSI